MRAEPIKSHWVRTQIRDQAVKEPSVGTAIAQGVEKHYTNRVRAPGEERGSGGGRGPGVGRARKKSVQSQEEAIIKPEASWLIFKETTRRDAKKKKKSLYSPPPNGSVSPLEGEHLKRHENSWGTPPLSGGETAALQNNITASRLDSQQSPKQPGGPGPSSKRNPPRGEEKVVREEKKAGKS